MSERLYIYVKDWEDYRPRNDRPNLPWLRLHTSLLGNDAWLELSCADRCLLITIWILAQRYGNGRVRADQAWLMSQANIAHGPRSRNLERLSQAGFITLSTTKAAPVGNPDGGLEERREKTTSSLREEENARASAAENGAAHAQKKISQEEAEELRKVAEQLGWPT